MTSLISACSPPPPDLPRLDANATILAFGDSLTSGKGSHISYPDILTQLTGHKVINAGISGETSTSAKNRFEAVVKQVTPKLIILCSGGNDFLQRLDSNQTKINIEAMVKIAKKHRIPIVLIAVPKFSLIPHNHGLYKDIANAQQLWLEDDVLKEVLFDNNLKSDTFHPNSAGYHKIAEAIHALLIKANAL